MPDKAEPKTPEEITLAREELDLRRYEAKLGFRKVIFGTMIVGLAGVMIPAAIEGWSLLFQHWQEETRVSGEERQRNRDFIQNHFETAIDESLELRLRFAEYYAYTSDGYDGDELETSDNWGRYYEALKEQKDGIQRKILEKERAAHELRQKGSERESNEEIDLAILMIELDWLYDEIEYAEPGRDDKSMSSAVKASEGLERIVMHWTASGYRVSALDREHYHEIVEGDGTRVRGDKPPEANISTADGDYAAHTLGFNRGSIGLAMSGMKGARQHPFSAGEFPITMVQLQAFSALVADYAKRYDIPITRSTVLTNAEVDSMRGVRSLMKWDITWLPGMDRPGNPIEVGDRLREMIRAAADVPSSPSGQLDDGGVQEEAKSPDGDE